MNGKEFRRGDGAPAGQAMQRAGHAHRQAAAATLLPRDRYVSVCECARCAARARTRRGQAALLPPKQACMPYPSLSRVKFAGSFSAHSHGPTIPALPSRQGILSRTCVWISSLADSPVWRPPKRRSQLRIQRLAVPMRDGWRLGENSPSWRASSGRG
jgi:hypothetical protein